MGTLEEGLRKNGKKISEIVNNPLNLRIPLIKKVEETAEQKDIDRAVVNARQYVADIPGHMRYLVARIQAIQATSSEERAIREKELRELEEEVLAHLDANGITGEAARQAYVMAIIATLRSDEPAILAGINGDSHLPGLLKLGALSEMVDDRKVATTVKVFGKTYAVNGGAAMEIANKLRKLVGEAYGNKIEAIKAKATISVADLLAGKSGRAFINAPDGKDGDRFLPGGVLLVQSDGKVVRVLEFLGHFQKIMAEIFEAKTFLMVKSLNESHLILGDKDPKSIRKHLKILHAVLRRGIIEAQVEKTTSTTESQMPMMLTGFGISDHHPAMLH